MAGDGRGGQGMAGEGPKIRLGIEGKGRGSSCDRERRHGEVSGWTEEAGGGPGMEGAGRVRSRDGGGMQGEVSRWRGNAGGGLEIWGEAGRGLEMGGEGRGRS